MTLSQSLAPDIPLLPKRSGEERPLLVILSIMACLASLTLVLSLSGFRTSQNWQNDNARALTIQVIPSEDGDVGEHVTHAAEIVLSALPGAKVEPIDNRSAQKLLKPWIGDIDLPEDLPLPVLLKVEKAAETPTDINAVKQALLQANIEAVIDDHSRWREDISRTWKTVQTGMWGIIMLVMAASAAIICYASRSVLRSRQTIINVLSHVGAPDAYIVTLFTRRFFGLGLKAGVIGAVAALLAIILFSARSKVFAADILPHTGIHLTDIIWLGVLVCAFGLLSGLTAIVTTRALINADRQPS